MRKALLPLLLISTLTGANAFAQQEPDTDIFNGKWDVRIQPETGKPQTARVLIVNFGGTWTTTSLLGDRKTRACIGKKFPVTVQVSQAAALEFTAWGAQVSPACPDLTVVLKPVSEKVLEGTLGTGETIRLTRPR